MGVVQVSGVRFQLERVLNGAEVDNLERALEQLRVQGEGLPFSLALEQLDDATLPYARHIRRAISELTGTRIAQQEPWRAQRIRSNETHELPLCLGDQLWPGCYAHGGARTHAAVLYLGSSSAGDATDFPGLHLRLAPTPGTLVLWSVRAMPCPATRPRALHEAGAPRWELFTAVNEADPSELPTREIPRLR